MKLSKNLLSLGRDLRYNGAISRRHTKLRKEANTCVS